MEKQFEPLDDDKMKELILDYIDGNLTGELKEYVANLIEKNEMAKKEFEEMKIISGLMANSRELKPYPGMKEEFLQMIAEEKNPEVQKEEIQPEAKVVPMQTFWTVKNLLKIAAAVAILVVGYFIGVQDRNGSNSELTQIRKEMQQMKELMMASLQEESASQRMKGVNVSYGLQHADEEVLAVLIKTLNTDPNANVRLASANALNQFSETKIVRDALIKALENEKEPVVQITLINIIVELGDKTAVEQLQKLVDNATTIETVKDEAHMGLFKLL